MSYLKSLFSIKRFTYKKVSIFAFWDTDSYFTKKSHVLPFAKLKSVHLGEYSRIGAGCLVHYTKIGKFSAIGKGSKIGLGRHPTNYLSSNSIFYRKGQFKDEWAQPIDYVENLPIEIGNDVWVGVDSI